MTIAKSVEGDRMLVALSGKLDTLTVDDLSEALDDSLEGVKHLVFDMSGLTYVSSAGLRKLFSLKKKMKGQLGDMEILNSNDDLLEIFDITGFIELLEIKKG